MDKSITPAKEDSLTIERGKLGSIKVYDVTEHELNQLEKGGSESVFMNFAIFALSIASSFLITLTTIEIGSDRVFVSYLMVTILGYVIGLILLVLWWKGKSSIKKLIKDIRNRIKDKVGEKESKLLSLSQYLNKL